MTKRILIVAALLFAALEASAGDFVDEMCKSYKSREGAQVVTMGKGMLSVAFAGADKQSKAVLKKIKQMTIVALDPKVDGLMASLESDLASLESKGAQMIGESTDPKTKMWFKAYVVKEGEYYTHLLMLFKTEDSKNQGLIDMSGQFLESELETLGKSAKPL